MSQQEFENFKQRIKDWMDSHPNEYDCFDANIALMVPFISLFWYRPLLCC